MYATNYYETMILNTLRGQAATAPTTLYVGLYLSSPGETGTAGAEVSYTGYQRQAIQFSAPAPANNGTGVQNTTQITFATTPAQIGVVTHIGVLDSVVGGNMLLYGEFTTPISLNANVAPMIAPGEAQWWMTGDTTETYRTQALNLLRGQGLSGITAYLALYAGAPGGGGTELSGGGYRRIAVAFGQPEEQPGGAMQISNATGINLDAATAPWGTWSHTALCDALTGGNVLLYTQEEPKEITTGDMITAEAGALTVGVS